MSCFRDAMLFFRRLLASHFGRRHIYFAPSARHYLRFDAMPLD